MTGVGTELGRSLKDVMSLESARLETGTGSATRAIVFDALRAATAPVTCEALAAALELHVNTVRGHLEALVAANYASRLATLPEGPGRPRMTYSAVSGIVTRIDELAEQLDDALNSADADQVTRAAADTWRESRHYATRATSPDEAVQRAVTALRDVGFEATADPFGESIAMAQCPYTALIEDYPVICAIHAQLVTGVLEESGQPVSLEGVDVWLKPGLCRARLVRNDLAPKFSVPAHVTGARIDGPQAREIS
jgi:predicted ArsR family transcriptional regulator